MKNLTKRFFSRTLAATLLLVTLILPLHVSANSISGPCGENSQWQLDYDTGILEITGTGAAAKDEYGSAPWSFCKKYIRQIYVREGITEIDDGLFSSTNNLYVEKISLPASVTKIGKLAFSSCENLTELVIPQGVTEIRSFTFAGCINLKSVTLPGGITAIGDSAFSDCTALTDIYFAGTQAQWDAINIGYWENDALENATVHFVQPTQLGWVFMNGKWYYRTQEGYHSGWLRLSKGTYYMLPSTQEMAVGWTMIDGQWYYFDASGAMHTGWLQLGSKWYYLNADGSMVTGTKIIKGKANTFNSNGVWQGLSNAGFFTENGTTYYSKNSGVLATGWLQLGSDWYYFDADGSMRTEWLEIGGKKYYLDPVSGAMKTGWLSLDDGDWYETWYYFNADGSMKTGWLQQGNDWYYMLPDGKMARDEQKIGSVNYFFYENGKMASGGWVRSQPFSYLNTYIYYYASADGALYVGWRQIEGQWHYFYLNGRLARNTHIDEYLLNADGCIGAIQNKFPIYNYHQNCTTAQAAEADAIARSIARDALENGGKTDYERVRYVLDKLKSYYNATASASENTGRAGSIYGVFVDKYSTPTADTLAMARVFDYMGLSWRISEASIFKPYPYLYLKMDGEYGFAAPKVLDVSSGFYTGPRTGFGNPEDAWPYWYDYEAHLPTHTAGSWIQQAGKWYYKETAGNYSTGMRYIDGSWYYFTADGVMKTGWVQYGGNWYYFNASGAMKTGWLQLGGKWYYLNLDGTMAVGTFKADGEVYRADKSGKMITGWVQEGGKWYYALPNGILMLGNYTIDGVPYYFTDDGAMGTGWFQGKNGWYYANASGVLSLGWKQIGGNYYYFYKDGHMAQETFIDNYFIGESGIWESTVSVNRDPQHYKGLTASQAAQADAIALAIAQEAMANGGDTDYEKISYASKLVAAFVDQCVYQNDENRYYRSPYGVFVAGVYTCAGSTRAMGRVLEFMGYTWYHTGEDQWEHQWVCVKMDGEYGWVEPQEGFCGFGNFFESYFPPA